MVDPTHYIPGLPHADPRRNDDWYPPPLGGGGGVRLYTYKHTVGITLGAPTTGTVDIYDKDNETTLIQTAVPWVGNLTMFDDQIIGDKGTCLLIGGKAYAINAPCSGSGTPSSSSGLVISATAPTDTTLLWVDTSGI